MAEQVLKDYDGFLQTNLSESKPAHTRTLRTEAYHHLSECCLRQGRDEEAIEWLDKALEVGRKGQAGLTLLNMANLHIKLGK